MSSTVSKKDLISILYNNCYGGWSPSNKTTELYNLRMKEIDPTFTPINHYEIRYISRHDPVLVQLYHELGKDFDSDKISSTKIWTIKKKYEKYYHITEYDGNESVCIDKTLYKLCFIQNTIRDILSNDLMSNEDKLRQIGKHNDKLVSDSK